MKKGAARSVVLAPGGTAAPAATQAGWLIASPVHAAASSTPSAIADRFPIVAASRFPGPYRLPNCSVNPRRLEHFPTG